MTAFRYPSPNTLLVLVGLESEGRDSAVDLVLLVPTKSGKGAVLFKDKRHARALVSQLAKLFREGVRRRTSAGDDRLSSDAPWIQELSAMDESRISGLSYAQFGRDRLLLPEGNRERRSLLCYSDLARPPEELGVWTGSHFELFPAPDDQHVVVEADAPSLTTPSLRGEGSHRALISLDDGRVVTVFRSTNTFAFGGTSGAVRWSPDGARFAMYGSQGQERFIAVFDVRTQELVDCLKTDLFFRHWSGTALRLESLGLGEPVTCHRWTPGREGSLEEVPVRREGRVWSPNGWWSLSLDGACLIVRDAQGEKRTLELPFVPDDYADSKFRFFGGSSVILKDVNDELVVDLAGLRYRYLRSEPGMGCSRIASANGDLVVFYEAERLMFGRASGVLVQGPTLGWQRPDAACAARAKEQVVVTT